MVDRVVRWRSLHAQGMEHLRLWQDAETIHCEGVVIGGRDDARFGFSYRLVLEDSWRPRLVEINRTGPAPKLVMQSDGNGRWTDGHGLQVEAMEGCIDIDIGATPFTNSVAINRLGLGAGESAEIQVAYVSALDFEVEAVTQRYTCLEPMRRYRYEGGVRKIDTVLEVDGDGLIVVYPERFEQMR